ncbi:MAG: DUF3530 family protein [Gammaproteobacteria bacterium]|nr:DUF3530 family protein [Gammaproteobacteria bacterium]
MSMRHDLCLGAVLLSLAVRAALATEPSTPAASPVTEGASSTLAKADGGIGPAADDAHESVALEADGKPFRAFERAARRVSTAHGAVLIIPDFFRAAAPSHDLIDALREVPAAGGWETLAIELPMVPLTASAAAITEAASALCPRLTASLAHITGRKLTRTVIVGVGASFDYAMACFKDKLPADIVGVAGVGAWQREIKDPKLPVFDAVPTLDPQATRSADIRRQAALTVNPSVYRQAAIDGVDRWFIGAEVEVAKRLRGWLTQLPRTTKS